MDRLIKKLTYQLFRGWTLMVLLLVPTLLSCGDEYLLDDVDCDECYTPKQETGPVSVNVTLDANNNRIPIKIFKGKYEERYRSDYSEALIVDTVSQDDTYIAELKVNEYYSVAAEYTHNGEKIVVVDGDKLKMYKVSDSCGDVCWIFKGGDIDATLKK